jgi:hypothetical protein
MSRRTAVLREGVELLGAGTPAGARLAESAGCFEFLAPNRGASCATCSATGPKRTASRPRTGVRERAADTVAEAARPARATR